MKNPLKKVLTKTIRVSKTRHVNVPPSQSLVYGISFAIVSLIALTVLEIVHLIILEKWSTEIFASIMLVIGTILGAFFGAKT